MHVILTTTLAESPVDDAHQFVTLGLNCWGVGRTAKESLANCKVNRWHDGKRHNYITRVAPIVGFGVDPVDGSVMWADSHNAKDCPFCTVGKHIRIGLEK